MIRGLTSEEPLRGRRIDAIWIGACWFVGLAAALFAFRAARGPLGGHDAWFHVAAARFLLEHGLDAHRLPWTRLSLLAEHWGDKEWLFHVFLMPFITLLGPWTGGHAALSALNGLQAGLLAYIGVRYCGRRGAWLPAVALGLSVLVWHRLDFLRPHNLALVLFLAGAWAIARRRYLLLGVLSAAFALSYTAWQAWYLLCAGTFALLWVTRRERLWPLLTHPLVGLAAGILLHPAFPHNVRMGWVQNTAYYRFKEVLPIGTEIDPLSLPTLLAACTAGLVLAALAAWSTRPWRGAGRAARHEIIFGGYALAFGLLGLLAYRFAEYAVPFLALYGFVLFDRLSANPTHAAGARRNRNRLMAAAVGVAVAVNAVLCILGGISTVSPYAFGDEEEAAAISAVLPPGARVAARWDSTAMYIYAAPQAAYLNVLDPVFMHVYDPALSPICEDFFDGRIADVADVLAGPLQSDYVALPKAKHRTLYRRLSESPAFDPLYDGPRHAVFRLRRAAPVT